MGVSKCICQLFEDVPSCPFRKLFSLTDKSVEFPILLDLHDIVEYALHFAVCCSIDPAHVEVHYLNDVSMSGLVRHLNLV